MITLKQYLYTVQVGRLGLLTDPTEEEKRIAGDHVAYMRKLTGDGVGIFGGAVKGIRDSRHLGLFVFQAKDDVTARKIVNNDPAVKTRLMRVCLYPYRIALWNTKAFQLETDQQHYLYHIQAIRPEQVADPTEWETEMTKQHFYYLKEQTEKGIFCIVGRTQTTDPSTFGMGVLRAVSDEEAWQISVNDPGVINPIMRLNVMPFEIGMFNEDWAIE
jgi:uncharacterized protein YciI